MNNTLRALIFGATVAATLTVTLDTVTAAEPIEVIRLEPVTVTAHRIAEAVIRLDPVLVVAHRAIG